MVPIVVLASYHASDTENFEVALRFLDNLCNHNFSIIVFIMYVLCVSTT